MNGDRDRPVRGQTLGALGSTALFLVTRVERSAPMPTLDSEPLIPRRPAWCGDPVRITGKSLAAGAWYFDAPTGLLLRCTRSGDGVLEVDDRPMTLSRGPLVQPRPTPRRAAR